MLIKIKINDILEYFWSRRRRWCYNNRLLVLQNNITKRFSCKIIAGIEINIGLTSGDTILYR
jgi:hypothetical protein